MSPTINSVKRIIPLSARVAVRSFLNARRKPKPFVERRAGVQLYQPLVAAHLNVTLTPLDGFSLYVTKSDYIADGLRTGQWEPHVTAAIKGLLKPGDTFLDVGANLGFYTLLASRIVGPSGRVVAVEPNPQNVQLICASLRENDASNVSVLPLAASDREGFANLFVVGSNAGLHNAGREYHLLAPMAPLDKLLSSDERINVVKTDIEGHEPAALRGMEGLLRRHRPALVTEFHPWLMSNNGLDPAAYLGQLASYGYELSVIEVEGGTVRRDPLDYWRALNSETAYLDLLALPA